MPTFVEFADRREALVAVVALLVLFGWALFAGRRGRRDLAELRSSARVAAPQTLYQLLAWTLASDGRTARLVVLLVVLLLLATFDDSLARVAEALFGAP
ncbi:hypothetical protein MCAG_02281 [Micromonospora sp. ATCC 39149]|uniref:Uncharacterized protein n=1 Tax=Micromonospora carbonacea TaxID=47853 RepID=A0A7D6C6V8_9ACTN|nr:hypothetical protein [Micromonospora sp. ATCC 39149]EEP71954.1 hypothetical protein MCAG_02281 [Micromonospora sp. ATCC 39149]QLJ98167.1 hypothetical protein HZU44_26160 [Micromonospora carbonacea]